MLNRFPALVVFILCNLYSFSQTAKIQDVWVDYNIFKNDMKGLSVHTKFSVRNMQDKKVECIVAFYDENKNRIKTSSTNYQTSNNSAVTWTYVTPKYKSTTFNDVECFMPYKALEMAEGKHRYYYKVFVRDADANILASSDYYRFKGTGAKKTTNVKSAPKQTKTYRHTFANGSYTDVTEKPDGSSTHIHHSPCRSCKSSGLCSMCHGAGQRISGWGRYQSLTMCTFCGASGKCKFCGGTGENVMVSFYDHKSQSMESFDVNSGKKYFSVAGGNSHDNNYNSSTSNNSTCNNCHGTGVDPYPWSDPASNALQRLPWCYTNSEGSQCPYCSERAWHQHYKCPSCNP